MYSPLLYFSRNVVYGKRKIENWILDDWGFICIPMMLYKGLGITSVQYLVFTAMAYLGYLEWKKSIKKNVKF